MNASAAFCFILAAVLCPFSTQVSDFDDSNSGYEFIYHDQQNLILTIHGDSCYYTYVPDNNLEYGLMDTGVSFLNPRDWTESILKSAIQTHEAHIVQTSTLAAMRTKYSDLLADFHCLNKSIFEMVFPQNSHYVRR